jgi:alkyldihydroxyacetonephosphate synthase
MSKPYKGYEPPFYTEVAPEKSYRSLFRWGNPEFYKNPREKMYKLIKDEFGLTDEDFKESMELGLEEVKYDIPSKLGKEHIKAFIKIVGEEDVTTDDYQRIKVSYGKTMLDIMRLRKKIVENVPDAVIYPETHDEVQAIIDYCNKNLIPVYVFGGGSSVTRGTECIKGGISLDLSKKFNKVIKFNEINQTITVQPGMSGPDLEKYLNDAVKNFGAKRSYTCGHFPQSFEYSSVGGWVVTRGAGQNSTYYGKIEDIVLSQKYATPIGTIETDTTPRKACGPDLDQIMMGSEGTYGVLTEVTLKIFRFMPENRYRFSYIFKDWKNAMNAMREVMQGEFGFPSVFRMSDPEETHLMLYMYGVNDMFLGKVLTHLGYKDMERCLMLGFTDGDKSAGRLIKEKIAVICSKYGGMSLTGAVTKKWEEGRFNDPYLRDQLQDFGIMIDTLECSVNWDNMAQVHEDVRAYVKSRPNTVCTTHLSHMYPQGANLYFIFISKITDLDDFKQFHRGILDAIQKSGAAISHHHGIGKFFAPWLEGFLGSREFGALAALKAYFDPNNILNPGGTLGFDLKKEEKVNLTDKK